MLGKNFNRLHFKLGHKFHEKSNLLSWETWKQQQQQQKNSNCCLLKIFIQHAKCSNFIQHAKCSNVIKSYCLIISDHKCLKPMLLYIHTVFDLITTHTPISAQSRNFVVFRYIPFVYFFIKAYVVGTHLNCIDLSMQFKWVPTTYAFVKKIRKNGSHHQISSFLIFFIVYP